MGIPGGWELLIVAGLVVLLFGAKKLPALGGAIGESIKNFKKGVHDGSALEEKHEKSGSQAQIETPKPGDRV